MSNNNTVVAAPSLVGLLGLMFVFLKLTGVITWSWWFVTMPFWGGLAIALGIVLTVCGVAAVFMILYLIIILPIKFIVKARRAKERERRSGPPQWGK